MQTRSKLRFDPDSPEIKNYLDQVHHHTFMGEGTMVAFPTCLPGMTVQIPLDESHITALAAAPDGTVYGATSGRRSHIFIASLHWLNGIVFDLGMPAGATQAAAVCCGDSSVFAFVNGPRGGRAVSAPLLDLAPQDLIQEWGFERPELTDHGECVPGEPVVHAVMDASRKTIVGITKRHIFTMDPASPKARVLAETPGFGRLGANAHSVYGRDDGDSLWRYDPAAQSIGRRAVKLPDGFGGHALMGSTNHGDSLLYTADAQGMLYSFDESHGFSAPLGRTPLTPVGPLGVTFEPRFRILRRRDGQNVLLRSSHAADRQPGRGRFGDRAAALRLCLWRRGHRPRRGDHLRRGRQRRPRVDVFPAHWSTPCDRWSI